jgi:very-short-patch-repair endonuclease
MDLSGSTSQGAHLLRAYLEYAEHGVASLVTHVDATAGETESPFEEDVANALIQHGFSPVSQVGCGGFRIDLALPHPTRPGEFCLGIECDGATYHSSKTARDRDRIRQSILEDHLGWRIVRIWSTAWVRSPDRQLARIFSAFEEAVASSNRNNHEVAEGDDGEEADSDLAPQFVYQKDSCSNSFANIADVPDGQIRVSANDVLTLAGATDWDDLVKLVARDLGFSKAGKRIRQRLEVILNDELQTGSLRWLGDRIAVP